MKPAARDALLCTLTPPQQCRGRPAGGRDIGVPAERERAAGGWAVILRLAGRLVRWVPFEENISQVKSGMNAPPAPRLRPTAAGDRFHTP